MTVALFVPASSISPLTGLPHWEKIPDDIPAFLAGNSPFDFPEENYEASWANRFGPQQLNHIGRRGLGL